ncbi:MAG: HNH endonuclease [Candidatus Krumholzibacteria bacterium]|nr:HNH endonuclease [Candidatus Krumholzibacteria bacterium]
MLNASFEPLNVINWKRAVKLIFLEKVEVLEETDHEVHSATDRLRVPAVVRLLRFVGLHKRDIKFSRQNIYARDKFRCQYCGQRLQPRELTCDHVIPRSRGGTTTWNNIVSCCRPCNRQKGGRTPAEAGLRLLKKPMAPSWLLGFHARFSIHQPPAAWHEYLFWSSDRSN